MKIGFIGLGTMGRPMCKNILKKHDDKVFVYDIIEDAVKDLADAGAVPCSSYRDVAENSDIIFSILPRAQHSIAVYDALFPHLREGQICVDMGTIEPSVSIGISEKLRAKGVRFADAPVIKPEWAAISGELGILVGCDDELFDTLVPYLSYMGKQIMHVGANGYGLYVKILQNTLTHTVQEAVNEVVTLAGLYKVPLETFFDACNNGGAGNLYFKNKIENLKNDDYTKSFSIDFTVKDLGLGEKLAIEKNFPMPAVQAALNTSRKAMAMGLGPMDTSSTILAVRDGFLDKNFTLADVDKK